MGYIVIDLALRKEFLMRKLPRYTLEYDEKRDTWALENSAGRAIKTFDTKQKATAGGVLERALGSRGGSVRIQKQNGKFQEERTYPGTADPRKSRG
jgi:hypothetical protein